MDIDSFQFFYLNDEDDSVYNKDSASKKYENNQYYYKVYYPKKFKNDPYTKYIINKISFGGYIIGFMEDTYALLRATGFDNETENSNKKKAKQSKNEIDMDRDMDISNTVTSSNHQKEKLDSKNKDINHYEPQQPMSLKISSFSENDKSFSKSNIYPNIHSSSINFDLFDKNADEKDGNKNQDSYVLFDKENQTKNFDPKISNASISNIFESSRNDIDSFQESKFDFGNETSSLVINTKNNNKTFDNSIDSTANQVNQLNNDNITNKYTKEIPNNHSNRIDNHESQKPLDKENKESDNSISNLDSLDKKEVNHDLNFSPNANNNQNENHINQPFILISPTKPVILDNNNNNNNKSNINSNNNNNGSNKKKTKYTLNSERLFD
jgi:hypothetical protein